MGIKAGGWLHCHLSLMCVLLPGPEWGRRWGPGEATLLLGPLALCRDSSASLQLPPTHCSLSFRSSPSAPTVGLETLGPDCDPKGLLPPAPVGTGRAEAWKGTPQFSFPWHWESPGGAVPRTWPGLHSGLSGGLPPGCQGTSAAFKV